MMQSLFSRKSTVAPQFSGDTVGMMWYLPSAPLDTYAARKRAAARSIGYTRRR